MKKPRIPPPSSHWELLFQRPQERIQFVLDAIPSGAPGDRYFHWDQVLHRKPPHGLKTVEWWQALKFRRLGALQTFPLLDKQAQPFRLAMVDTIHRYLHEIDFKAGGQFGGPQNILSRTTQDQYHVSSLIEEAITSSQLEGAATTHQDATKMLREDRPPRDKSERMIANNYETMQRIGELKTERLTKDLVFELHRTITVETLHDADSAGRFRTPQEYIRVADQRDVTHHVPPPAVELPARMDALCAFANGKTPDRFVHPVIRAIILHFWLAYDHPFVDGNGRAARALFYWSMLRQGYWLAEYLSISSVIRNAPTPYYRAFLYTETDENDLTYFVLYHLDVIQKAVENLLAYIERKTSQVRDVERRIRTTVELNHRQLALLSHALRHPTMSYTIESHRNSHKTAYDTARTDLLDLADKGLLTKRKSGRTFVFTPAPDVETRMSEL